MCRLGSVLMLLAVVSTAGVAAAQTKITIGYAAVSPRTTPLYIAQEQGIFSKYGLDAKVVLFRGAPTLVASLVSGEMEVGYTGGTSVVGAAGQATYLRILSSISSTLTHTMMAHPSIKRVEELRGKRFRHSKHGEQHLDAHHAIVRSRELAHEKHQVFLAGSFFFSRLFATPSRWQKTLARN